MAQKTRRQFVAAWQAHVNQLIHLYIQAGDTFDEANLKLDDLVKTIEVAAHNEYDLSVD